MSAIDVVAMIAAFQHLVFASQAGKARCTCGVRAPAVAGHERFEHLHRVQTNTAEKLVALLPALHVAARGWTWWPVAGAGGVHGLGRVVCCRAQVNDPSGRSLGFLMSFLPIVGLALAGLAAAVLGKGPA